MLPKSILVCEIPWTIEVTSLKKNDGETVYGQCIIRIHKGLSEAARWEVLLHEILHIVFNYSSLRELVDKESEEKYICALSPMLFSVLRRNNLTFSDNYSVITGEQNEWSTEEI